jgi:hypothetical protein
MKIKGLRSICGSVNLRKNEIKNVDEETAKRLVKVGYAVFADEKSSETTQAVEETPAPKKRKSTKKKTEAQDG